MQTGKNSSVEQTPSLHSALQTTAQLGIPVWPRPPKIEFERFQKKINLHGLRVNKTRNQAYATRKNCGGLQRVQLFQNIKYAR